MYTGRNRKSLVLATLISIAAGPVIAQEAEVTDLTRQQVTVDQLVAALDIPILGVEAKCAPVQEQMARLTRGVGSVPKTAKEVPSIAPMKTASVSATFELNSDELTPEAKTLLGTVAKALNAPELSAQCFQLAGHTCDLGDDAYNLDLSQRRADAVKVFLVDQGVEGNRLVTTGFGELSPLVANQDEETRHKNRRVDLGALAPTALEYE
jgi:outer membrane protein OmpA-like peptidoglycan-associated protein